MVFNITHEWVKRSEPEFFLGEERVAYKILHIPMSMIHRTLVLLVDMQPSGALERQRACTIPRATN